MFWSGKVKSENEAVEVRNEKKVVDQLKKAAKTAEKCLEALLRLQLYIEILEKAHFYISDGLENTDLQALADSMSQKIKGKKKEILCFLKKIIEKQSENHANAESEKLAAHFEELSLKMKEPSSDEQPVEEPEVQEESVDNPASGNKIY